MERTKLRPLGAFLGTAGDGVRLLGEKGLAFKQDSADYYP